MQCLSLYYFARLYYRMNTNVSSGVKFCNARIKSPMNRYSCNGHQADLRKVTQPWATVHFPLNLIHICAHTWECLIIPYTKYERGPSLTVFFLRGVNPLFSSRCITSPRNISMIIVNFMDSMLPLFLHLCLFKICTYLFFYEAKN